MEKIASGFARFAGLATCVVVGLPPCIEAATRPDLVNATRLTLWIAGLAVFMALFWLASGDACERLTRRQAMGLLALQSTLAVALPHLYFNGFPGILLVLVATVVLDVLSPRAAVVWIAGQTVAFGFAVTLDPLNAVWVSIVYAAFQVFALYTSLTARKEREGREELVRVNAELLATRKLLEDSSRAAERLRIARELHDVMGHHLTALSLGLEAARHAPQEQTPGHVEAAQALTKRLLQEIRRVVGRLREEAPIDLAGALAELAAAIERPRVHLAFPDVLHIDDPERAHALLRCAQEVVTNAMKHAAARNVWLELVQGPEGVELRARDDGRGTGAVHIGSGLSGMRERLGALGGRLAVESAPDQGFRVTAWLPLPSWEGLVP